MLRNLDNLKDFAIEASDGKLGQVTDFYFDDHAWAVRYLVVDTGNWLSGRQVLISPFAVKHVNWVAKTLSVGLTMAQVKGSPGVDTHRPVSRQHEVEYLTYYGYPYYWGGLGLWGAEMYPDMTLAGYAGALATPATAGSEAAATHAKAQVVLNETSDPHLRSHQAVMGYHLHADDGDIGHVQGLLFDEKNWAIRYLMVDTSNWWLGHKVLVAQRWIKSVDWASATISVSLSRQAVQESPPFDFSKLLNREQELALHHHYKRIGYWKEQDNLRHAKATAHAVSSDVPF